MPETSRPGPLLPTGTVTFLFTDIEGSTRLWEKQHAAMQLALAQHDAILRNAIETNNGWLFKTTGDGAHAAFALAADALTAGLAAQRALTTYAWGELRIKARMALHSGAAELRDGDYFGPALNRTARLMAAGHGGQILLSLATEELVRDHLPANTALRDMGERRLKDLIRPERVYQVITPELPADFPPLLTLDARPNNLPAQATPFIGRDSEIRAAKEQLASANVRLLTLSGVGGTGKTRLALQVAADMVDDFEHGVFFVPLAPLSDPGLVLQAIAQTFGVRERAGRPLKEQLQDHLRDKQILLVLDNFEQVIDAASLVSDLLTVAPRLKVLVTSREVLRLYGESNYPVPPLSVPDPHRLPPLERMTQYEAVALFIDRALAVAPDFTITNENAPAVAEICHRLDGLPLAIELAAARARVLPPQRMLVELSHRLTFVTGRARDLPTRQRTLRGAIDWSHDLLTGDEQKLFRRLGIFVGGCALEAIESICNLENDLRVLETMDSLVGKSLLKQAEIRGEPRFTMLETIREYARERLLAEGDTEKLQKHHRDYFLALTAKAAPKLMGAEQAEWFARLDEEHDNLRSALESSLSEAEPEDSLRLCSTLQRFWWTRGHLSEGRAWCARALVGPQAGEPTPERAKALSGSGLLAFWQGDYPAARAQHEECLAIWRQRGDRRGIALSLNNLGMVARSQGDYAAARTLYEESFAMRELSDRWGAGASLMNLGNLAAEQGDYGGSRTRLEESLAIFREIGDRVAVATALENLGNVAYEQGELASARALHVESLTMRRELGDKLGIVISLERLAGVIASLGSPLRAARIWGVAERLRAEIGSGLEPKERSQHDQRVAAARATVQEAAAFDRAWQTGGAMSLEQAMAYALEQTQNDP
jgi:predicted ATPase/class 3 adenylate cyclase/Tfp pilus assembly protein PilF